MWFRTFGAALAIFDKGTDMKKSLIVVALVGITLTTYPAVAKKRPEMTPMQLQALQSREYKTTKDQVFASMVSVFQDLGYQISGADMASGFITAGSANKNKTGFFEAMAGMRSSGQTRATAFVEQMPSGLTRVRLNFLNTKNSSSAYGSSTSNDRPILEPKTYQIAFERVEQALFERSALTKTATPAQPTVELPVSPNLPSSAASSHGAADYRAATTSVANASGAAMSVDPNDPPGTINTGRVKLIPSKTLSGYCIRAAPRYSGTGSASSPAITTARPLCQ